MSLKERKPQFDSINGELANMLLELGEYEKNVNKQHFKYIAYRNAANSVNEYDKKIESAKEARNLRGVGKRIAEKIDEYLKKGHIKLLDKARRSKDTLILKDLNRVFGIGPTHAWKLYKEGIKSIEDLRDNLDKLTEHQQIGLKYLDEFGSKIPRVDMDMIRDLVTKEAQSLDPDYHITLCGSYRRGAESSNDIDVLVTHPNFVSQEFERKLEIENNLHHHHQNRASRSPSHSRFNSKHLLDRIINRLFEIRFLTDTLAHGDAKYMGVCINPCSGIHHRIDIRVFPYDEYFFALLYFTGSDRFNVHMRKLALQNGFTLNEYSLRRIDEEGNPVGKTIPVKSEREIFEKIGIDYTPPEERNFL